MKRKTKLILFSAAFLISILMFFLNIWPAGKLFGVLLFIMTLIALFINLITNLAGKNKSVKLGIKIGAILAIPFFILLVFLEMGTFNNDRGICLPHPMPDQLRLGDWQPICDRFYEAGLKDGEEWNVRGITCVEGVYSSTNYRCITYPLGFRESEAPLFPIWIILAEFYGILAGALIGWIVSKFVTK